MRLPRTVKLAALALAAAATSAQAIPQRFGLSSEANTLAKGAWEFESKGRWDHLNSDDSFSFAHEFEYGITDKLELDLYVSEWSLNDTGSGHDAQWDSAGAELFYNISDPTADPLGSALGVEVQIGQEFITLESLLVLQKNFGPVSVVYNAVLEAEWAGDSLSNLHESNGAIDQTLGVNYSVGGGFYAGAEAIQSFELENWHNGATPVFVGPSVHFRTGSLWATVGGYWQVTSEEDISDFQMRVKVGFQF